MVIRSVQESKPRQENDDAAKERGLSLILELLQTFHTPYKEELIRLEYETKSLERLNTSLLYQLKKARVTAKETLIEVCFKHNWKII